MKEMCQKGYLTSVHKTFSIAHIMFVNYFQILKSNLFRLSIRTAYAY